MGGWQSCAEAVDPARVGARAAVIQTKRDLPNLIRPTLPLVGTGTLSEAGSHLGMTW